MFVLKVRSKNGINFILTPSQKTVFLKIMRKLIALFFLTTFLLSNTEAGQLLKTQEFIAHYKEHSQSNPRLSVWAFFQLHYSDAPPHDNNDMKLPFKTHHDCCANNTVVFFQPTHVVTVSNTITTLSTGFCLYKSPQIPKAQGVSIFQPPRNA